jgi:cytochrome b561
MQTIIAIYFIMLTLVLIGIVYDKNNPQEIKVNAMYVIGFLCGLLTVVNILG